MLQRHVLTAGRSLLYLPAYKLIEMECCIICVYQILKTRFSCLFYLKCLVETQIFGKHFSQNCFIFNELYKCSTGKYIVETYCTTDEMITRKAQTNVFIRNASLIIAMTV